MKILLAHNQYQQPGGEDAVHAAEAELLKNHNHSVVEYRRHNNEIRGNHGLTNINLLPRAIWAKDSYEEIRNTIERERPILAHFHNIFPLISPASYYACREAGVPVIQTLHNYRLFCPAATFFRNGQICQECIGHGLWRGVRYGCYRGSRAATATVALMLAFHRYRETWTEMVDCYIVLSQFSREKFVEAGLPSAKVLVKPNFVHPDPGVRNASGDYVLFVGRLSREKGLHTLLAAWEPLRNRIPLHIVGDGPLRPELNGLKSRPDLRNIHFHGYLRRDQVHSLMKNARFLVFPSEWYECFPLTVAEAFACGTPVITSQLGAMAEIVEDHRTGLHFIPGDSADLAAKVDWAWSHPQEMESMGREARAEYVAKYTAERNYQMLMDIYARAKSPHL